MGSRTRGRPPTRWKDDVENDLKTLNIKNWQRVAAYHWNWRKRAVEAAKTYERSHFIELLFKVVSTSATSVFTMDALPDPLLSATDPVSWNRSTRCVIIDTFADVSPGYFC
ncbi:hypothetical protein TNCV_2821151 [Trichonephila clavipes]|nr:hypothetical protein TNCV_2821151 [Trichonephila clavipes]